MIDYPRAAAMHRQPRHILAFLMIRMGLRVPPFVTASMPQLRRMTNDLEYPSHPLFRTG